MRDTGLLLKYWVVSPVVGLCFACAANAAHAQDVERHIQWRLGVGGSVTDSPYAGEGSDVSALPLIFFDSPRFFFHATQGGMRLHRSDAFEVDLMVSADGHQMDPDDLGWEALAANNVDKNRLEERDRSYYAGLRGKWNSSLGVLEAEVRTDISGNSEGEIYTLLYQYPWQVGRALVTPYVSVNYLSDNVTSYYYGVEAHESLTGTYAYQPDAALVPGVGVRLAYALDDSWSVMGGLEHQRFPSDISDSPLIEDDHKTSLRLGILYSF